MKRKKVWFMGLAMLTATILIVYGYQPSTLTLNFSAQAEDMPETIAGRSGATTSYFETPPPPPKPKVAAASKRSLEISTAPKPGPSPTPAEAEAAPKPGPSPAKEAEATTKSTPTPTATPTPTSSPEAKPEAKPAPAVPATPATTVNTSSETISGERLPLNDAPYSDPQGRFEVGILENYNVSAIADAPLIESPDGTIAYTVVVQQKISNEQFTPEAIAQMAINQFQGGEGFQADSFKVLAAGEILIPWTGRVTIGRKAQPISGSILVRQNSERIVMLLLSGTDAAGDNLQNAIATLSNSLKFL